MSVSPAAIVIVSANAYVAGDFQAGGVATASSGGASTTSTSTYTTGFDWAAALPLHYPSGCPLFATAFSTCSRSRG